MCWQVTVSISPYGIFPLRKIILTLKINHFIKDHKVYTKYIKIRQGSLSKLKSIHTLYDTVGFQLYFNKDFICNVHVIYFEYIRIYFNLLQRSRRLVSGRLFFEGSEQHTCDLPVWSPDKLRGSDGRFGSRGQYQTSWKDLLLQMNSVNFYKKNNDKTLI